MMASNVLTVQPITILKAWPKIVLAVCFGAAVIYSIGYITSSTELLFKNTGWAVLALIPLTIALFYVYFTLLFEDQREWCSPVILRILEVVRDASPLAGLLGTFLGVSQSIAQLAEVSDPEQMQQAFQSFLGGLAQMLTTSIWGVLLTVPAMVTGHVIRGMALHQSSTASVPAAKTDYTELEGDDDEFSS